MTSKLKNELVTKSIQKLYLNSNTADVHFSFTTGNETIKVPAHKAILATASPVFEAMFFGQLKENDVIKIVDASASSFQEFLQFFYLSEISFTMENIEAVAHLADKYDMMEFLNSCANFLENQITEENILWGYHLAILINNQKLKQFCELRIKTSASDLFKTDEFLHCDKSVVENILQLNPLNCKEVDLFTACVEWAKVSCIGNGLDGNDAENIKQELNGCLHLIRFDGMSMDEIGTIMSNEQYNKLFTREELADIICMKADENFQSNVFKRTHRALEWISYKDLECGLLDTVSSTFTILQSRESTWFSTNIPVLLGKIEVISNIYTANYAYANNIELNISIFEFIHSRHLNRYHFYM